MSTINPIGTTSLGVAALRAMESMRPDKLIDDPYAMGFVAAAGGGMALPGDKTGFIAILGPVVAVRTKYFDESILAAARGGCRQVVMMASGMDSRAYRLDWPADTELFELDQPEVLAFKNGVLGDAKPKANRHPVGVDLVGDWTATLRVAGFDPEVPTAWLTEGIIYALTPEQADLLLERITSVSAPGSVITVDQVQDHEDLKAARLAVSPDLVELWVGGPTGHPADWLHRFGWKAEVTETADLARTYGREVHKCYDPAAGGAHCWLATATR
ncbi:class I SAM-dependent methyltransferase [Fodinicola feengrottensis]|uniref:S-adenosyl-L-methionine-dependent methyltransferase n=1 Tax=Fodinicola feengrottensis TaxID=435914 RepID=A0ABN2INA7_9ACTN